jgi:hypothetical protein
LICVGGVICAQHNTIELGIGKYLH